MLKLMMQFLLRFFEFLGVFSTFFDNKTLSQRLVAFDG